MKKNYKNKSKKIKVLWKKTKVIITLLIILLCILYSIFTIAHSLYEYYYTHPIKWTGLVCAIGTIFAIVQQIQDNKRTQQTRHKAKHERT